MKVLDAAKAIRRQAKELLERKKIASLLEEMGELFYTGSYALDLMTWNDIDMQIIVKEGSNPLDVLGLVFQRLAKDEEFVEAQLIRFQGGYKPKMPRGVYLGIKMNCPDLGGLWKLDVWSLDKKDFERNRQLILELQKKLTAENRELILTIKREMMAGKDRMPQMGSHFLYQAVLFEGIKDKKGIYEYCASRGVPTC